MVHVNVPCLFMIDGDNIAFESDLGYTRILESQYGCQKEAVQQVTIIIQQLQINLQAPHKLALDDTETLSIRGS